MKHATSIVLALFGLAAAAPAQVRLEGILGRHIQVGIEVGDHGHGRDGDRDRSRGYDRGRERRGGDRDHDRRDHDRRSHGEHRDHGYWTTVRERNEIPGYWREERQPARYGWIVDHCGNRVWGVVAPACVHRVWVAPRCEYQSRRVWVRC